MATTPPFFTPADIDLMAQVVGKPYDPKNPGDIALSKKVKNDLWRKTIYWHDEVLKQLLGFTGIKSCHWNQRIRTTNAGGNSIWTQGFKPYTWTRIVKQENADKDIFFTVGIEGAERVLFYKLDYKHIPGPHLNAPQRELCETLIKQSSAAGIAISPQQLPGYDWPRLIGETVDFIRQYEPLYDQAITEVYARDGVRLARIAYNTEGWRIPSGPYGKSHQKNSHEAHYGFGHEEWLCDTDKLIDGYHYAFLEPIYKYAQNRTYEGCVFDLLLYTINSETGERYWVGKIHNAAVIDLERATEVWLDYDALGWLDQMRKDVESVGGDTSGFPDKIGAIQLFNIRFHPDDLTLYDLSEPIFHESPIYNCQRYVLLKDDKSFDTPDTTSDTDTFDFDKYPVQSGKQGIEQLYFRKYERKPKVVESHVLHEKIARGLHKYLAETEGRGYDHVKQEVPAGYEGKRIDMVVKTPQNEFVFYEIKTYPAVQYSIREALGQILEYAFWPDQNKAAKLVILTQPHKDCTKVATYMKALRQKLGIEIYYQYFDPDSQFLSEEI